MKNYDKFGKSVPISIENLSDCTEEDIVNYLIKTYRSNKDDNTVAIITGVDDNGDNVVEDYVKLSEVLNVILVESLYDDGDNRPSTGMIYKRIYDKLLALKGGDAR